MFLKIKFGFILLKSHLQSEKRFQVTLFPQIITLLYLHIDFFTIKKMNQNSQLTGFQCVDLHLQTRKHPNMHF